MAKQGVHHCCLHKNNFWSGTMNFETQRETRMTGDVKASEGREGMSGD